MRRADLIAKIKAGQTNRIEKLLFLDLNMDQDWWNTSVNPRTSQRDIKLAEQILGTIMSASRSFMGELSNLWFIHRRP